MWERTSGPNNLIQTSAIKYLAKSIGKDRGDAREMLRSLDHILRDAIATGLETVDMKSVIRFVQLRSGQPKTLDNISVIDQLALVVVYKARKQWRDAFLRYL